MFPRLGRNKANSHVERVCLVLAPSRGFTMRADSTMQVAAPSASASSGSWLGDEAVARDEHASNVLGLRRAAIIGLVAWPLFGLTDLFVVEFVQPGRLWLFLLLRAVGLVILGIGALRLHRRPTPSPGLVRFLDVFTFTSLSVLVSAQCVEFGGIASPLSLGIVTILACRTAIVPDRWQRGLLPIGLCAFAHPATLLALTLVSPVMAAQLALPRVVGLFVLSQFFVLGTAAITLVGAHRVWALRRKVYEARSLGRYRLIERIGRGGMGEVWVAHHNTLKRDVAVKILRPDKTDDLTRERFEREVRATSELCHPNTVRVFDYGVTEDGLCYYAMELLAGEDLGKVLRRHGPLEPERVVRVIHQAAKALAEAHDRGIVHRDLKPENIFITSAGCELDLVKVLDFGLALVNTPDHTSALTHTGWVVGTPAYIAPEVLMGHQADARSDVYALGAVMYKLLCGRAPFAGPSQRAMLVARMQQDAPPPSTILGAPIPVDLEDIVLKCLQRRPGERFPSAAELAEALDACRVRLAGRSSSPPKRDDEDLVEAPTRVHHKSRVLPRRPARVEAAKAVRSSPAPAGPHKGLATPAGMRALKRAPSRAAVAAVGPLPADLEVLDESDTLVDTIRAN